MKTLMRWLGYVPAMAASNELEQANAELQYLRSLLNERYESEWKITKDGKRRYRKVATKVLVNAWVTESEPIDPHAEYMRKLQMEEDGIQVVWD